MARSSKVTRGGPGYFGLIFFIVLCLLLIGGYAMLVPAYAKRGASLNRLHSEIKSNLEDPLGKQLSISSIPQTTVSDPAYDATFFTKVRDAAQAGVKYQELVQIAGFPGDDPNDQIKQELARIKPLPPETLRAHIEKLRNDLQDTKNRLDQANTNLAQAVAARDTAQRLQREAEARANKERDDAAKALAAQVAKNKEDLDKTKEMWLKADAENKKTRTEMNTLSEQHKTQVTDMQEGIRKLEQTNLALKEDLERRKPREIPVLEGRVLQVNLVEGIAIINVGKRESIQNGEKFTVVRPGRGGERIVKGEIQVVRVDELVSRADILSPSLDDPILRDDIILRQKRTEEAPEAVAAK